MSLVWHIIKKDLRRMVPAAALWLVLVVAGTLAVRLTELPTDVALGGEVSRWLTGVRTMSDLLLCVEVVLAGVLVAFLVQEDALTGTESYWLTRPIGRGRLFVAKVGGAALLFVALPLVALGAVWLASGFSLRELAWAGAEFAGWQIALIAVAVTVAAITADLGKFLFAVTGLALAAVVVGDYRLTEWLVGPTSGSLRGARTVMAILLAAPLLPTVLIIQFATRRTRLAWKVIGVAFGLMLLVRVAWPVPGRTFPESKPRTGPETARFEKLAIPTERRQPPAAFLTLEPRKQAGEYLTPWNASGELRWANGRTAKVYFNPGGLWGEQAVKRLLGMAPDTGPVTWDMATWFPQPAEIPAAGEVPVLEGYISGRVMRAKIVAELPWRAGATAQAGSSWTRVVSIGMRPNSTQFGVVVEERDAWLSVDSGARYSSSWLRVGDTARRDSFALVNRRLGIFKALHIEEAGTLRRNSLLLSGRTLEFDPPTTIENGERVEVRDWERDAVLVKVRFEATASSWVTVTVPAQPLSVYNEEKKP